MDYAERSSCLTIHFHTKEIYLFLIVPFFKTSTSVKVPLRTFPKDDDLILINQAGRKLSPDKISVISHFLTAAMKFSCFSFDEIRLLCFQSLALVA